MTDAERQTRRMAVSRDVALWCELADHQWPFIDRTMYGLLAEAGGVVRSLPSTWKVGS